jgi:hypothetical protein
MTTEQFDRMSKTLTSPGNRRWAVWSMLAAAIAVFAPRPRAAGAQGQECADRCADLRGEDRATCQYQCAQGLPGCGLLCILGYHPDPTCTRCVPDH